MKGRYDHRLYDETRCVAAEERSEAAIERVAVVNCRSEINWHTAAPDFTTASLPIAASLRSSAATSSFEPAKKCLSKKSDAQKRKPRRGGVLQTVSLTSFSLRHPGRILRVRVVASSFLLYVHGK